MSALFDLISHMVALLIGAALVHFGLMSDYAPARPAPAPLSSVAPEAMQETIKETISVSSFSRPDHAAP